MRGFGPLIAALALGLAGCGARTQTHGAGNQGAAAVNAGADDPAASATPQAPAAEAAAGTPVGPCPFATRGWEAAIEAASQPGEKPSVALNGEVRPDKDGRMPTLSTQGAMRPPVLVLELLSDSGVDPLAERGWMGVGGVFGDYDPQYTYVAVRCADIEIVRVPIRPAQ